MTSELPEELRFIEEPYLKFGYDQALTDPKDGLFFFGPLTEERKPAAMRVGVIGTAEGLAKYRSWVATINGYIPAADPESPHHTAFPGFEAVFKTPWPVAPVVEIPISASDVSHLIRMSDRHFAIYETVSLFSEPIRKKLSEDDLGVDVWFVVVPEEIYQLGRPLSRPKKAERIDVQGRLSPKQAKRLMKEPSLFEEDMKEARVHQYDLNFHHQLKARLLDVKAVVQVVRDTSLVPTKSVPGHRARRLQDPATIAWNLCTTAYFKAGGRPWKLASVRDGVCYVGLVFKITQNLDAGNACCGAQMFLNSGDGLVFKGAFGDYYSSSSKEFHLPYDDAKSLIELVINAYTQEHGIPPKELFVHGRTKFSDEEWRAFQDAVPAGTKVVTVRISRSQDMKIYRPGKSPVLRGTAYKYSERRALLWTMGYIPHLRTYPGREVPNPLSVEVCQGEADIDTVLKDVMALTKVNFNACIFADGLPVTLRFADAVGEILTAGPIPTGAPLPFRHYI